MEIAKKIITDDEREKVMKTLCEDEVFIREGTRFLDTHKIFINNKNEIRVMDSRTNITISNDSVAMELSTARCLDEFRRIYTKESLTLVVCGALNLLRSRIVQKVKEEADATWSKGMGVEELTHLTLNRRRIVFNPAENKFIQSLTSMTNEPLERVVDLTDISTMVREENVKFESWRMKLPKDVRDDYNQIRIQKDDIVGYLQIMARNNREMAYLRCRETIQYDPKYQEQAVSLLKEALALAKVKNPDLMIKGLFHMVKNIRFRTDYKTYAQAIDPLVAYYYSPTQGTGKTEWFRWFLGPIWPKVGVVACPEPFLMDERQHKLLQDTFALVLDDVGRPENHAAHQLAAALKSLVSMKDFKQRTMYTLEHSDNLAVASIFMTSNISVTNTLGDPTGMRRFFQMETDQKDSDRSWIDRLKKLDATLIWKGVNPNATYYSPLDMEFKIHQRGLRPASPLDEALFDLNGHELVLVTDEEKHEGLVWWTLHEICAILRKNRNLRDAIGAGAGKKGASLELRVSEALAQKLPLTRMKTNKAGEQIPEYAFKPMEKEGSDENTR